MLQLLERHHKKFSGALELHIKRQFTPLTMVDILPDPMITERVHAFLEIAPPQSLHDGQGIIPSQSGPVDAEPGRFGQIHRCYRDHLRLDFCQRVMEDTFLHGGDYPLLGGFVEAAYALAVGALHCCTIRIAVANLNQPPRLQPLPLQLVREGDTLGFTVRAGDADQDAIQLALVYNQTKPPGVPHCSQLSDVSGDESSVLPEAIVSEVLISEIEAIDADGT